MFLALHHCNLHWNILCYCSSCKVDSSSSLNAVYRFQLGWWAHFLIVSGSSSHCSPSLLPCPVGISHVKTCIGWHSNQAGLIWIGRSEQLYGWFLVRVTWKKRIWIRSFPFPLAFSGSKHPSGVRAWHWWHPFWWLLTWCGCYDYCSPADVHGTWNGSEI